MKTDSPVKNYCRPLTLVEAARCADLHATAFHTPWSETDFSQMIADPGVFADGVWLDSEKLSGFAVSRKAADEAEILTIAVAKNARGQGAATNLLCFHLSRLTSARVEKLFLEVSEDNISALALYRRFGFERVGRREAYYAAGEKRRANALIMRCAL